MDGRHVPMTMGELCWHALELKRYAESQWTEYAKRLRVLDEHGVAGALEDMVRDQSAEIAALDALAGMRPARELSPWEFVWHLSYLPEALEQRRRVLPMNGREALQLSLVSRRRAEKFYNDVAASDAEGKVRDCAAELAGGERWRIRRLEQLLAEDELAQRQDMMRADARPADPRREGLRRAG